MKRAIYHCRQCREYPEGFCGPYYCSTGGRKVMPQNTVCLDGRIRKESDDMITNRTPVPQMPQMCACGRDDFAHLKALKIHIGRSDNPLCAVIDKPAAKRPVEQVLQQVLAATSVVAPREDGATPGEVTVFSHCDRLEDCLRDPQTTDCGADPCNLVTEAQTAAEDAPKPCEVCGDQATHSDVEGVPLCDGCMTEAIAGNIEDALEQMDVPAEVRDQMMKPVLADLKRRYRPLEVRSCRVCGCTDEYGCEEGCTWVEEDLCSACADTPAYSTQRGVTVAVTATALHHGSDLLPLSPAQRELVGAYARLAVAHLLNQDLYDTSETIKVLDRIVELSS